MFDEGGAKADPLSQPPAGGPILDDLAVPLSELEDRSNYGALRDALLDGYARQRPLPRAGSTTTSMPWAILRRIQLIMWILNSGDLAAFRKDWLSWARKGGTGARSQIACPSQLAWSV